MTENFDSKQHAALASPRTSSPVSPPASSPASPAKHGFVPTASGTVGPFFPPRFLGAGDNDLTIVAPAVPAAQGERIHISGHVYEAGRVPRLNTIVEIWQADANGCFAHPADPRHAEADPHFMGWGRTWTDQEGCFEFITVKPGAYLDPVSDQQRAPHINISFTGSGLMRRLVTTLYFPDDARNDADPVLAVIPDTALRARLLLKPAAIAHTPAGAPRYVIDIVLQGADETPFFVD